jgi:beta-lactamase class A
MLVKEIIIVVILVALLNPSVAQSKQDRKLQKKIEALIDGFNGNIGVYVKDIRRNKIVVINADSIFPTASMVKIPILIGVMDKIDKGELQYHDDLIYKDSLLYEGVDILGSFRNDEKIDLGKVVMLMLTMSDNTASLWLQSLAGTGSRINQLLDSMGFQNTRVNSRTPGREMYRSIYGWGQTTPREMAELLAKIYRQEVVSPKASSQMMRLLGRNYWDEQALSAIPPTIEVFSKNGAVNGSRSEVLLVNAPKSPYVFCICTKNNKDESWTPDNEAWKLIRKISALLWDHFN